MNNASELSLNPVFSTAEIMLSPINNNFIQNVIEDVIPADVWKTFESAAVENNFYALNIANAKKSLSASITKEVDVFWDMAQNLERQGYKITEFKLNIQFTSHVAQTQMTCDIVSNATEKSVSSELVELADSKGKIRSTKTDFQLEHLPLWVDKVRNGNNVDGLPRIVVSWIQEALKKNPNWLGDDLEEMNTSESDLNLYTLTIKPMLSYESDSELIGRELINEVSTVEDQGALAPFKKTVSSERSISSGLFANSIYTKFKPVIANPIDSQLNIASLSMNGSSDEV